MGSSGESPLALELDDILSRYTSPQKTEGSIRGAAFVVRSANGMDTCQRIAICVPSNQRCSNQAR